jgi:hypothetical protein
MVQGRTLNEAGILLKRYLVERGRSQVWLTRELGMAQETLSKKLRGKLPMDREAIYAIGRILDLSDDELRALMAAAGEKRPLSPSPSAVPVAAAAPVQPAPPRTSDEATESDGTTSSVQENVRRRGSAPASPPVAPQTETLGQQLEQLATAARLSRQERAMFEKRLLAVAAELLAVMQDVRQLHATADITPPAAPN